MNNLAQKIQSFLKDGYYAEGVAIIQRCDVPHTLKSQFARYLASPFVPTQVEKALQDELRRVLVSMPLEERLAAKERAASDGDGSSVKLKGPVSGTFWGRLFSGKDEVPAEVWELYQRALELHKEHSYLHAILCEQANAGDQVKTRVTADQIMETVIPALDTVYDAARAWGDSGKIPTGPTRNQMLHDLNQKYRQYQNLGEKIKRLKRFLQKETVFVKGTTYRPITQVDREKYEEELIKAAEERAALAVELEIR